VAGTLPGTQLSLFAAAFRLVTVIATPLLALQLTLTPTAASLYGSGKLDELESVSRRAATLATIPALLSLVIILAAPQHLMTLIFGAGFAGGASILLWLTAGQVVNSLTGIGGQILTMTGHQRDVLWISTVALVLKLAIGIPVALTVGVVGYAAVSSITTAAMNVAFVISLRWRMGIWCLPSLHLGKGS
jgi:O-antigen/teichoic acid export membrane protein